MTDAKTWLSRGFWLRQERDQIQRLRNEVFDRLTKCTQDLSDAPTSGTKDPHRYDLLAEYDIQLAEKEAEIDKARFEIYKVIDELGDPRYRILLKARYCEGKSWPEVHAIMNYDPSHVFRLHGMALLQIAPLIEKKTACLK